MPSITADLPSLRAVPHVTTAELDDTTLTVSFDCAVSYTVVLPEDYPRGEPLLILGDDMEPLNAGRLDAIARQLWNRAVRESARSRPTAPAAAGDTASSDEGRDEDDSVPGDGCDADGSEDAAVASDEETGEMMTPQFSTGSWQREGSAVVAPAMTRDVECVNAAYGPATADTRVLDDTTRIVLDVPLAGVIDRPTAKAFGADFRPITIEMKFSTSLYTDQSNPPTFEVTQSGEKFALGQQLSAILVPYLKRRWTSSGWTPLENQCLPANAPAPSGSSQADAAPAAPGALRSVFSAAQKAVSRQLVAMGFAEDVADVAASKHDDVDVAVAALVEAPTPAAPAAAVSAPAPAKPRHNRAPKATVKEDRFMRVFKGEAKEEQYRDDVDPKKIVRFDPAKGFLSHLVEYVQTRVRTVCDFCVICDKPHVWTGAMLRPTVCSRSVCVFAFQELNVGADAADGVAVQGGVIDLLVTIFKAAAKSTRAEQILNPFPHVFDPDHPDRAALDPERKNLEMVRAVADAFPSLQHVVGSDSLASLRLQMAKSHRLAFPLLSWVINSNRSLLMKVDDAHRLSRMGTRHQFMLVMAPPEKQAAFDKAKKSHGTKYAFHGSRIENWHAILRNGLRNCSGTDLQLHGAAQGSGIYFAKDAATSIGYCQGGQLSGAEKNNNVGDLIDSENIVCLALCEIVSNAINDHGWCWTVADETKVMTRFFFVFSDAQAMANGQKASTSDGAFTKEILALQEYYGAK